MLTVKLLIEAGSDTCKLLLITVIYICFRENDMMGDVAVTEF